MLGSGQDLANFASYFQLPGAPSTAPPTAPVATVATVAAPSTAAAPSKVQLGVGRP